jgi:hypothetical protein
MTLFSLIFLLVVVGVCLYIIRLIPMDATIKQIITILAILVVALYVLKAVMGSALDIHL